MEERMIQDGGTSGRLLVMIKMMIMWALSKEDGNHAELTSAT